MADGQGFFEFNTNIDAIAAQITEGLDQIVQTSQRAAGTLGQSNSTQGFLNDFRTQIETLGKQGIAQIEQLGVQFRDAFAKSFGPGGGGAASFVPPSGGTFASQTQGVIDGILGQAQGVVEKSLKNLPAGAAAGGVTSSLHESVALLGNQLGKLVGGVTTDLRGMAPIRSGTATRDLTVASSAIGENLSRDIQSSFASLARQVAQATLAATPEAVAAANQFAQGLSQMSRRATLSLEQQGLLLSGSLGRGPLAGLVTREAPGAYSFTPPGQDPVNIVNGRLASQGALDQARSSAASARTYSVKVGDNYVPMSGQEVMSQAALNATRTNFDSVEQAAKYIVQQAEVQQQLTQGEKQRQENLKNEARLQTVNNDTSARATRPGGSLIFSPAAGGFVNAEGALLTKRNEIRAAYGALNQSLESEVRAAEKASQTPLGALSQGFFGAGGRKRTGGAGEVDQQNPLNGFFETAGIVAKYELQGIAIFKMGEYARQAFSEMAQLDQATQLLNATLGSNTNVSGQFINNLENIATVAGENVVEAVKAAQAGIAAFANAGDSVSTKEKTGQQFVGSAVQLGQITGTSLETASHTDIAVGTSYDLGVDKLGQVANAVQVARNTFGSNNSEVMEGLRELADAGKTAGYSMNELAQVIGVVQARTAEGGTTIAQSLGRIFSLFQSKQATGFLQTLGIDTSGSVKQQIEAVASAFTGKNADGSASAVQLSEKQKAQLEAQLGGQRSLKELIPLLSDQVALQKAYANAINDSSAAQRAQNAIINSVAGQLRIFGQTLRNLALDIARSGIFAPLGVALKAIEPLISTVDKLIQQWDRLPGIFRGAAAALLEVVAVMKIADTTFGANAKAAVGGLVSSISPSGRAQKAETTALRLEGTSLIRDAGAGYAAGTLSHEAATAQTAEGLKKLQQATETQAAAAGASAAANTLNTGSTTTNTFSRAASTAADKLDSVEKSLAARREAVVTTGLVGALERFSLSVAEATLALGGLAAGGAGSLAARLAAPLTAASATSLPVVGTALLVAGIDYEISKHLSAIHDALSAGDKAASGVGGTTDVAALKQQAADLSKASGDIKHASSGFFGTITGGLSEAYGGRNRGQEANALKGEADALYEGANLVDKAQQKLFQTFNAGGIDFQAVDGVSTGLKNMVAQGGTAADQLRAVTAAMEAVASAAHGTNVVLSGQTDLIGAKIGTNVQQQFFSGINDLLDLTSGTAGGVFTLPGVPSGVPVIGGSSDSSSGFRKSLFGQEAARDGDSPGEIHKAVSRLRSHVNEKQLTDDLTQGMQQYLRQELPNGGVLDNPEKLAAVQKAKDVLVASLQKQGIEFAKLPKSVQDYLLTKGVQYGTEQILNSVNKAGTPTITKDNINEILKDAPALAQQAGQNAATSNSLQGFRPEGFVGPVQAPSTNFSAVVGAQATLAWLTKTKEDAAKVPKTTVAELNELQTQIDAAKVAVQSALLQEAQALAALAAATVSPFDKAGQIDAELGAVSTALSKGVLDPSTGKYQKITDPANIAQLKTRQAQLSNQKIQQAIEDSVSGIGVSTDSRNSTQAALDNVNKAKSRLDKETAAGAKGQDLNQAQKEYNDAKTAYNQSLVDQSAAQEAAAGQPGNPVSQAAANLASAQTRLNGDLPGTTQWWQDYKSLKDAQYQASVAQLEASKGAIEASVIPGDKVSEAKAAIAEALIDMQKDRNDAGAYGADVKRFHDAQYQLAEAYRELANNEDLLGIDLTDPVATANAAVRDAKRKLTEDRKRGVGQDVIAGDEVDLRKKQEDAAKQLFDQRLNDEKTMLDLYQISGVQYADYLHRQDTSLRKQLETKKKGSEGYRRLLDQLNEVDKAILDYNNQFKGQFNFGDIKLPTPYEMQRYIKSQAQGEDYNASVSVGGQFTHGIVGQNHYVTTNNVHITGADLVKVKEFLLALLGTSATGRIGTQPRKV